MFQRFGPGKERFSDYFAEYNASHPSTQAQSTQVETQQNPVKEPAAVTGIEQFFLYKIVKNILSRK